LQVVGGACSCLAGEDSGGSAEARIASATWAKPPSTTAARPFIVITVLNSQYLLDNEDGIYAPLFMYYQ
jgi:hypothetical protein